MPVTNFPAFDRELREFAEKHVPAEVNKLARVIAIEALSRIVMRTPVDLGHHRGSWQVELNRPAAGFGADDKRGGRTISAGVSRIVSSKPFDVIHITNSAPAIDILENGGFVPPDPGPSSDPRPGRRGRILVRGGYSVQAPRGMVAITLAELRGIFGP